MCDYCGCRRQRAVNQLSDEHERLVDLGYGLRRRALEGDRGGALALLRDELLPLLRAHTDKEERGLFVQLRACWEADGRLDALIDEHRDIDELLDAAVQDADGWAQHLVAATEALAEHVLAEEVDLFPYAMYELSPGQWDAVEAVHAAAGRGAAAPAA